MTSSISSSSLSPSSWSDVASPSSSTEGWEVPTYEDNGVEGGSGLTDESCDGNETGGSARSECITAGRGEVDVATTMGWDSVAGESSD